VDLDEVFDCARKEGVAIEINAQPTRLDLDWRYVFFLLILQKALAFIFFI
jgi:histidinol phosphatase-like PHP family hydrolase